jgi:hypothetical protein
MRKIPLALLMVGLGFTIGRSEAQVSQGQVIDTDKPRSFAIAGRWESLQWTLDVWNLDLQTSDKKLTGTISITSVADRPSTAAVEIYEGKVVDINQIEFKAKSPDNMRVIVFSGVVSGDEIRFTRKVEMPPGASAGNDDLMGANGPLKFTVKRVRTPSRTRIDQ